MNPLRYRGYFYDPETGFYYLNSRYYDPATRRFISADNLLDISNFDGMNLYAYCLNNPVMYSDPDGDIALEAVLTYTLYAVGGAIVSYCAGKIAEIAITNVMDSPSVRVKDDAKAEEKEKEIVAPKTKDGMIYYHATTMKNAKIIYLAQTLYGSDYEGNYIYAWKSLPDHKAVNISGARGDVVISFRTNAAFEKDPGVIDKHALRFGPVRSVFKGPITIWDVKIVRE